MNKQNSIKTSWGLGLVNDGTEQKSQSVLAATMHIYLNAAFRMASIP